MTARRPGDNRINAICVVSEYLIKGHDREAGLGWRLSAGDGARDRLAPGGEMYAGCPVRNEETNGTVGCDGINPFVALLSGGV